MSHDDVKGSSAMGRPNIPTELSRHSHAGNKTLRCNILVRPGRHKLFWGAVVRTGQVGVGLAVRAVRERVADLCLHGRLRMQRGPGIETSNAMQAGRRIPSPTSRMAPECSTAIWDEYVRRSGQCCPRPAVQAAATAVVRVHMFLPEDTLCCIVVQLTRSGPQPACLHKEGQLSGG